MTYLPSLNFSFNNIWTTIQSGIDNAHFTTKSIKIRLLNIFVKILEPCTSHTIWEIDWDISEPLQYTVYENPFSFNIACAYTKNIRNILGKQFSLPFRILPQWFEYLEYTELKDDNESSVYEMSLSKHMGNCTFDFSLGESSLHIEKHEETISRYIEVRLNGTSGSLFEQHYPMGIELTEIGNIIFSASVLVQNTKYDFKLYEFLPFLLYFGTGHKKQTLPYEKDSLFVTLLEDDTFSLQTLKWNDSVLSNTKSIMFM